MVKIKFINPILTNEVKQGQVIEALPGSKATQTTWFSKPVDNSPTNVFGYVRGILIKNLYNDKKIGQTLVDRIYPFGGEYLDKVSERNISLLEWGLKNKGVYLVVGELEDLGDSKYTDIYSPSLRKDALTLSPEQIESLRDQLLNEIVRREGKDYVCVLGGNTYSLKDIVLSLREKS